MNDRTTFSAPLRLLGPARTDDPHRLPSTSSHGSTRPIFDEPSLFYDPPYANQVHDEFAWHLVKYLKRGSGLRYQVAEPALEAVDLTVDFVVERKARRVGVMCGTSEAGAARDRLVDALRIRHANIDVLYRLRAHDIEQHLHDALLLVARWDAALFSDRGQINLNTLATPEARAVHPCTVQTTATVQYKEDVRSPALSTESLRVQRLSRAHPDGWMPAYEQAREHFGITDVPRQRWARSA